MIIDRELEAKIDKFIEQHKTEIVNNICELVEIKSVAMENASTLPYGDGCRKVLDKALEISERMGFEIDNCDYYCGSASLNHNDSSKHIAFWGHLDVVEEGEGWDYPPYEPTLHEGYLIGRGVSDNKGPSICALYTLLFFKENEYNMNYNYKVIFGTNEEAGMDDVEYFLQHRPIPDFSIIADSVFPICYAEKGGFHAEIEIPLLCDDIISMSGGTATNAVANSAEILLKKPHSIKFPTISERITLEDKGDYTKISATGIPAHAASPEGSINAINILATYLSDVMKSESVNNVLDFISNISGTYDGSEFGIKFSDDVSGELTCVIGMLRYKDGKVNLSIDIRYPIKTDVDRMITKIKTYCDKSGAKLINMRDSKPVYVDPNDELVVLLNDFYNDFMGSDIPPYYEGGGSYARKVPNSLAYGPILHERKPKPISLAKGGAHKANESLCIDELLIALKIYILTVLKLDDMEF